MFDNIGGKIKTLALVTTCIGILFSIIAGISLMVIDEEIAFVGLIIMVLGSLSSWISSFVLYGLGQLIENTDQLVYNSEISTNGKKAKLTKVVKEDEYREKDFLRDIQQETIREQNLVDFEAEIRQTETSDLELIFNDQKDLYSEAELEVIKNELSNRKANQKQ